MTTSADTDAPVRLYGGWRKRRGIGLWGLDATSTGVVLLCALVPLLLLAVSPRLGLVSLVPAALNAAAATVRVDGRPLAAHLRRRFRWGRATHAGGRAQRFSPGAPTTGRGDRASSGSTLPAPLGALTLHTATTSFGRSESFAVVHDPARASLTLGLRCAASSAWLVDRADADDWVSAWHSWLAQLGRVPSVRWVGVVVETAPEPGTSLQESVLSRIDQTAPADARQLLRLLVDRSPAAAAHVATWVTITFDAAALSSGSSGRGRSGRGELSPHQVAEADRVTAGLESSLAGCGVTVLGRADKTDLLEVVAAAYDPASRGRKVPLTRRGGWADAAPVAVDEEWDRIRHDSGVSVSWGWQEAPRQQVTSDVLARLHSPGRFPKRVALLYRPLPAGEAARQLESEVNAAAFRDAMRRAQRRDETARDVADREQARRAAREEALGAGVVLVSIYVTTTVTDGSHLAAAAADVEARADQAKIRLRRLYGGQALGLATTLPLGIHPLAWAGRSRDVRVQR